MNPKETRVLSEECAFVRDIARGINKVRLLSDSQVFPGFVKRSAMERVGWSTGRVAVRNSNVLIFPEGSTKPMLISQLNFICIFMFRNFTVP